MNQTHLIIAIGLAVVVIGYFLMRKKPVPAASVVPTPVPSPMSTTPSVAPGVSQTSGEVPTPIPAPPRDGVVASIKRFATPTGQLQHIPIIGNTLATINRAPLNASLKINSLVTSSLEHIPVAGKLLAAPGKVAGKVLSSIGSWF